MERLVRFLYCVVFCSVLTGSLVWAQGTAQISGTVRDQSGAVLPGVEITATQTETGIVRMTVSNETGSFVLPNLPLGPYRVEATLPGFRTFAQTGVVLQVNSNPVINPVLEVGQVTEQVEVEANAVQVETRSAGVGQVIETQRILDLPLNGRNVTDLITLSGAAVQTGQSPGYGMRTGVLISVAGGNAFGVQYNLDGAPHIHTFDGTSLPLPFPDALQEFRFSTSTQDASNGMHSGAAVNAVTKSGTNAFHGSLFEFVRNNAFNARDYFALNDDGLKRHQFGGTLGGPIRKDKMFFFAGYQGTTVRQRPSATTVFLPTPEILRGDFTTFASPACQNGRQINLRAPFVNNRIDPNLMSPAALKLAALLPQPLDNCGTYKTGSSLHENDLQIPVRVDYQLNDKQSLFARYLLTRIQIATPQNLLQGGQTGSDDTGQTLAFGHTYLLGPNVVNSFRVSLDRISAYKPSQNLFSAPDFGVKAYSYLPHMAAINVSGAFGFGCGTLCGSPEAFLHTTTGAINNDVTVVKGSHQFAFGGHYMRSLVYTIAYAWAPGSYSFTAQNTGLALGDFFTGKVTQLRQANPNPLNLYQDFMGFYAQDTWKVTPKLTATYGLRWEPFFPMNFKQGDLYNFSLTRFYAGQKSTVIPNAPPGFTYPGDPGFAGKAGIETNWKNLDPRIGLAWDINGDGRTAVRIGAGVAHDFINATLHQNTSSVSPFRLTVVNQGVSFDDPWANYPGGNPFPYYFNKQNPVFVPYGSYLPVPHDMKATAQYSWNLGIQRQITPDLFVSGTYVGSHLIHTWTAIELNPAQFLGTGPCTLNTATGPVFYPVCSTPANLLQRRILNLANPDAALGYITQYDDGGTQSYNGMLLDMRWRASQQFSINTNYTWSHCIGLPTVTLLNPGQNYVHQAYQNNGTINRNLDVGNCSQDRRQIFNMTLVAKTPQFENKTMRVLGSGWSFSTIYNYRTGTPLNIIIGTDVALNGFQGNAGAQRPNQVLADPYGDRKSLNNYLNRSAFAVPDTGAYGNTGAYSVVGPGYWGWDQAVSRQFRVREGQTLEFRAEAFNVTNSLRRGNPGTTYSSANTFGLINSSVGGPRILQFAVKYVF
jgi:hypothetical protein